MYAPHAHKLALLQGWELEQLEVVDPDTKDCDLEEIKHKWKVIGATALLRLTPTVYRAGKA